MIDGSPASWTHAVGLLTFSLVLGMYVPPTISTLGIVSGTEP